VEKALGNSGVSTKCDDVYATSRRVVGANAGTALSVSRCCCDNSVCAKIDTNDISTHHADYTVALRGKLRVRVSETTRPNFTKFSAHVTCGRGSVFFWRRCNTLCTSGSV